MGPHLLRKIYVARLLAGMVIASTVAARAETSPAVSYEGLDFPKPLSPQLPYDVDLPALQALSTTPDKPRPPYTIPENNIPQAQRWFDVLSWQAFIALNWPALSNGEPDTAKNLSDANSPRVWEYYVDSGLVYRENGAAPDAWAKASAKTAKERTFWMSGLGFGEPADNAKDAGGIIPPVLDESIQAFTGPLVDQNGKWVRYQVVLNKTEFDYLVENKLYNLEGQVAFTAQNQISFPANDGTKKHGSIEVKLAWKQMEATDDRSRFLVRKAHVLPISGEPFDADFGLVGMHISMRTESSPTWVWATFEQVDNTAADDLQRDPHGKPRRPNFFNPDNPVKPVNILPPKNAGPAPQYNAATGKDDGPPVFTTWDEAKTTDPTQVLMVLPVSKATAELNRQVQLLLREMGSVFQYYELIGTQWPAAPSLPAFPSGVAAQPDGRLLPAAPESILFKIPGKVVPVHLVNTTMETYFQNGNQVAGPLAEDDRLAPGVVADPSTVFATESCAGCHFSAGAAIAFKKDMNGRFVVTEKNGQNYRIPIFGKNAVRGVNGNADYSWLLQLRAQSAPYQGKDIVTLENSGLLVPNTQASNQ